MEKILVTGSSGFIGMHLCKSLLEDGYQVVGIDNMNDYYDTVASPATVVGTLYLSEIHVCFYLVIGH